MMKKPNLENMLGETVNFMTISQNLTHIYIGRGLGGRHTVLQALP